LRTPNIIYIVIIIRRETLLLHTEEVEYIRIARANTYEPLLVASSRFAYIVWQPNYFGSQRNLTRVHAVDIDSTAVQHHVVFDIRIIYVYNNACVVGWYYIASGRDTSYWVYVIIHVHGVTPLLKFTWAYYIITRKACMITTYRPCSEVRHIIL